MRYAAAAKKAWQLHRGVAEVLGAMHEDGGRVLRQPAQAAQRPELSRDPRKFRVGARAKVDACAITPPVPLTVKAMKHALH